MRNFGKHAALVLFSLLLCALVLEGAVRLYSAFWFPRMMQLDDQLGWKHTPSVSKTFENKLGERVEVVQNVYGHRGPARPLAKTAGKYRLLVLGDSFTEGVQVGESDLFTAVLERNDPRLEVLNTGVGGYGTVQEYLYLEAEGLKHNPDLVLLMVFDNDLADNCLPSYPAFGPKPYAVRRNGGVEIMRKLESDQFLKYSIPVPFAEQLNKHSYLFYFLNTSVYQRLRGDQMRAYIKADMQAAEACSKQEVIAALMEKMQGLVTSRGARFAVVLIPTRDQARQGNSLTMQPIADFCQRRGFSCLSLVERFARDMDSAKPYLPNDIHWTKAGHRIAAEEIGRFLQASGALPARTAEGSGG
jgi:hypothetical protein